MNSEKRPHVRIFDSPQALGQAAAEAFREAAGEAERAGRLFHVALSGGSSPKPMFKALSRSRMCLGIPWRAVHLYWVDERCVPPEHAESNYGTAFETFLKYIPIPRENVHRIPGEETPERACRLYVELLRQFLPRDTQGLPQLDWIFLGAGTDGHTASLFPGDLSVENAPCRVAKHPDSGQSRVTLTLPVIQAARRITFLVTGPDKAEMVANVILGRMPDLPAARVGALRVEWWLDSSAASQLD